MRFDIGEDHEMSVIFHRRLFVYTIGRIESLDVEKSKVNCLKIAVSRKNYMRQL